MSPSFFQTMGVLQSKVEEELEFLDVRSSGPMQLGNGLGGRPGCWAARRMGFQGPPIFLSRIEPTSLIVASSSEQSLCDGHSRLTLTPQPPAGTHDTPWAQCRAVLPEPLLRLGAEGPQEAILPCPKILRIWSGVNGHFL